jgi:hypothetical protein
MLQRLRHACGIPIDEMEGDIELDEVFIGGKNKYRH